MALPSLSVIIPNLNHASHLPACLETVLSQSVLPAEVLMLDDGSTDDSLEVMASLARQHPVVRVLRNERNLGVLQTVNRGIDLVSADYFLPLAADDRLLPGLFEKTLGLLAAHPQAAFCGGVTEFRDTRTGLRYYYGAHVAKQAGYLSPEEMTNIARRGRMLMFALPMVLKRQTVIAVGKYYPELKWCSDWFTAWVAGYQHGVCYLPEVLGCFEKSPDSYSGRGMRRPGERHAIYRLMLEYLDRPQYREAAARIRRGAALAPFGKEMLWRMVCRRRYWRYLTPAFLRQVAWWSLRTEMKKILPVFIARWYFQMAGYSKLPGGR